ncbi:ParB/RepB/Spo0J family partition protein [Bacteroides fragilis]|uniref:ParB/RepB/Spo0J family partition protein n=1 Tax=Bacteroides fragilis TaxID=817 RepID=UPI0015F3FD04|nr:ParB N-terminal domain-containing protein [Bacteroides fragilis]MBA5650851.1 ParB N-terminal domain-containing protein [Bacteroides fragilis]MCE9401868.1 ParB N-terminal domain-containing protein [Bacteroides fragilis]MCZ2501362.1 ParB N-terminal domain-containing protein [Bacteroides fragilis]
MEVQNIRIDLISPSPLNPRKTFDEATLKELANNIEKQGLLQPITVRVSKSEDFTNLETGDVTTIPCSYEIVCGERRFRAVSLLKAKEDEENTAKIKAHRKKSERFQTISCIVREMTDDEAFDAMITENLHRKDVDPIEEAFAFAQLSERGRSYEDIALKFGKSARFVFDRIKLNSLIPELKERVRNGDIPLSGAMILSKLDEETQKEFHEEEDEQCTTAMIRDYVSNSFMELKKADWIEEDADNWENGEFKPCSQCESNTCNHGCLFYEMNNKDARCINATCFNKKRIAYVIRKILLESENLVKVDEPLSFGKTVIVAKADSYWSDERKKQYESTLDAVKQLGFTVVNPDEVFKGQCWYSEDDERILKMIDDGDVYRCISFFGYYYPEFKVNFYYVRKDIASGTTAVADVKEIEREKIKAQLKRNKEIVIEKSAEEMRKWAQEKPYFQRKKELSIDEQTVFDVMVLRSCDDGYLKTLQLSRYDKKSDFVEYVKNNKADRDQWYRAFIANSLSANDVMFYPYMQKCQNILFHEQYPDEYFALGKKLNASLEKKQKKLNDRLKDLDNDNTEEA